MSSDDDLHNMDENASRAEEIRLIRLINEMARQNNLNDTRRMRIRAMRKEVKRHPQLTPEQAEQAEREDRKMASKVTDAIDSLRKSRARNLCAQDNIIIKSDTGKEICEVDTMIQVRDLLPPTDKTPRAFKITIEVSDGIIRRSATHIGTSMNQSFKEVDFEIVATERQKWTSDSPKPSTSVSMDTHSREKHKEPTTSKQDEKEKRKISVTIDTNSESDKNIKKPRLKLRKDSGSLTKQQLAAKNRPRNKDGKYIPKTDKNKENACKNVASMARSLRPDIAPQLASTVAIVDQTIQPAPQNGTITTQVETYKEQAQPQELLINNIKKEIDDVEIEL